MTDQDRTSGHAYPSSPPDPDALRETSALLERVLPSHMKSDRGGQSLDEAESLARKRARELRETGSKADLAPQFTQDGANDDPVTLDSILSYLTDAPIQQTYPVERKMAWGSDCALAFGLDCAERVLEVFRKAYPRETSVPLLYEVGRRYLRGQADETHIAKAVSMVQAFASKMPDHWTAAGEAAGAVYAAVIGEPAKAAESARQAAFGKAGGPRPQINSETYDPYSTPGAPPSRTDVGDQIEVGAGGLLERFHDDPNPWESNKKAALKLHKSPVLTAEADERAWQIKRLEEYIFAKRKPA